MKKERYNKNNQEEEKERIRMYSLLGYYRWKIYYFNNLPF